MTSILARGARDDDINFVTPHKAPDPRSGKAALSFTIEALLAACGGDLQGLRDGALLSVAYDAGLRVAELVAIQVVHVEPGEEEGCGLLLLPRSKTDQMGEGAYTWLSPDSMRRIGAWLVASAIHEGPLFRRVGVDRRRARPARPRRGIADLAPNEHLNWAKMAAQPALSARIRYTLGTKPLTRQGVTGIIRRVGRAAADAGLVALMGDDLVKALAALSSHSLRVGLTQDLFAAGEDLGPVS